jgi:hypothetical protein
VDVLRAACAQSPGGAADIGGRPYADAGQLRRLVRVRGHVIGQLEQPVRHAFRSRPVQHDGPAALVCSLDRRGHGSG